MRILYLFCALLFIADCGTQRTVGNRKLEKLKNKLKVGEISEVDVSYLEVGLLEGVPQLPENGSENIRFFFDSLIVQLDGAKHKYQSGAGVMKLGNLNKDTLTVSIGGTLVTEKIDYRIESLSFGKVIFIDEKGLPVESYDDTLVIKENFGIKQYSFSIEPSLPGTDPFLLGSFTPLEKQVREKILKLERLLAALEKEVAQKIREMPDHAARLLPGTIEDMKARLNNIKRFYQNGAGGRLSGAIQIDLNKLNDMEYSIIEIDLNSDPYKIENEVLLETGEYTISRSTNSLNDIIATIGKQVEKYEEEKVVDISLAVTGYADEQRVNDDLARRLRAKYPNEEPQYSESEQAFLNRLLSQARADNVYQFIQEGVYGKLRGKRIEFLDEGSLVSIGKGWEKPNSVNYPCGGDCQERRVVFISIVLFPSYR